MNLGSCGSARLAHGIGTMHDGRFFRLSALLISLVLQGNVGVCLDGLQSVLERSKLLAPLTRVQFPVPRDGPGSRKVRHFGLSDPSRRKRRIGISDLYVAYTLFDLAAFV